MPLPTDPDLLAAALIGYQVKRKEIDARMSELRTQSRQLLLQRRSPKPVRRSAPSALLLVGAWLPHRKSDGLLSERPRLK